jgi:FkbM family methyltransferase
MKLLVNLLCCFVPGKKKRKEIKNKLIKSKERRQMLLDYGCALERDVAVTKEQIKFDISDSAKVCAHIGEIFANKAYDICHEGDSVVIDVGMNRAVASLFFASKKNVKKVYAFEPFEPTVALAKKNLALNPEPGKKIHVFTCGLGKEDAVLKIPYSLSASDCMSTTCVNSVKQDEQTETVVVKDAAKTLAPILEENKNSRIIFKCDCEGAEFEIFERLQELHLVDKIDVFLVEYHFEKPDRIVKILVENDFAVQIKQGTKEKPITGYLYAVRMRKIK